MRRYGSSLVECLVPKEKLDKLSFMKDEQKLDNLIFLIFLIPSTPKISSTYLPGLTPVKFSHFLLITTTRGFRQSSPPTLAGDKLIQQRFRVGVLDLRGYDRLQRGRHARLPRRYEKRQQKAKELQIRKRKQKPRRGSRPSRRLRDNYGSQRF